MSDDHPDHIEDALPVDGWVDAERAAFWARIRAMSSALHKSASERADELQRATLARRPMSPEQRTAARERCDAMNAKISQRRRQRWEA